MLLIPYSPFEISYNTDLANRYTKTEADAKFATISSLAQCVKVVNNSFRDVSFPNGNFLISLSTSEQDGYRPVGIVGWSIENRDISDKIFFSTMTINSEGNILLLGRNSIGSAYTLNPYFAVLYIKT